jgi:hypothetical protein
VVGAALCVCAAGAAPAEAEWAFGAYLGAAHTTSGALSATQPAADTAVSFAQVDYTGESFTPPLYYGYRVTYFLPDAPWLGVEAEFIHLKAYADTNAIARVSGRYRGAPLDADIRISDLVETFSISHGLNFALVNVVLRRALAGASTGGGRVHLIARAGAGPTIPHAESRIGGAFHEGYELGAAGLHAAGGIEIGIAGGLTAMIEYKLTTTKQSVAIAGGRADGRFTSHHGVFGVAWHP